MVPVPVVSTGARGQVACTVARTLARTLALAFALTLALAGGGAQVRTGYAAVDSASVARDAWRMANTAMRANDLAAARSAVERAVAAWPTQEAYAWGRAAIAMSARDTAGVLAALSAYAQLGFGRDLRRDTRFTPFLASVRGAEVAAHVERNREPLVRSRVRAEFGDSTFWPEGVDIDVRSGHAFVTSIRHRTIAEVAPDGRTIRHLPAAGTPGLGAMFGVRVDARRGVLWATTSGVRQMANYVAADSGIAALLRIRLSDGVVERRWDLPPTPAGHVLGDVSIAENGDVFMTDSNEPVLYRLRASVDTLERMTHPLFRSLQGIAPAPDGNTIYVADWTHGLLRVNLATRDVIRLEDAPGSSSLGCDGIALHNGAIIAVQNGAVPNRIMRFTLDRTGTKIARADVIDRNTAVADAPTIGTIAGNEFVYVANSHWEKYDDRGVPLPNTRLTRPVLLAVRPD